MSRGLRSKDAKTPAQFFDYFTCNNPFDFLTKGPAALYRQPDLAEDPIRRQLYELLKQLSKRLEPHVLEYAVQLTFQADDCKESGNVAHKHSRLSALLHTCVLFPYKVRHYCLCGGARNPPESRENEAPSWYDPEVLFYPLTRWERKRRIHEVFLRLLQTSFTNWRPDDDSDLGLEAERRSAMENNPHTQMCRQDIETKDDEVASWGSGWTEDEKAKDETRAQTERLNFRRLFQPIPSACARLTPHKKRHDKLVCGADDTLKARMWGLYKQLSIPLDSFIAVVNLLLPFQFDRLREVIGARLAEKIPVSEMDFLGTAMKIFIEYPIKGGPPMPTPDVVLIQAYSQSCLRDASRMPSYSPDSNETSNAERHRRHKVGPRRNGSRERRKGKDDERTTESIERDETPPRPRQKAPRRSRRSVSSSSSSDWRKRNQSSDSFCLEFPPPSKRSTREDAPRPASRSSVKASSAKFSDASSRGQVRSTEDQGRLSTSGMSGEGRKSRRLMQLLACTDLTVEDQERAAARLAAEGFTFESLIKACTITPGDDTSSTTDFYKAMHEVGLQVRVSLEILRACRKFQ